MSHNTIKESGPPQALTGQRSPRSKGQKRSMERGSATHGEKPPGKRPTQGRISA